MCNQVNFYQIFLCNRRFVVCWRETFLCQVHNNCSKDIFAARKFNVTRYVYQQNAQLHAASKTSEIFLMMIHVLTTSRRRTWMRNWDSSLLPFAKIQGNIFNVTRYVYTTILFQIFWNSISSVYKRRLLQMFPWILANGSKELSQFLIQVLFINGQTYRADMFAQVSEDKNPACWSQKTPNQQNAQLHAASKTSEIFLMMIHVLTTSRRRTFLKFHI
jgi:hypothetical protein